MGMALHLILFFYHSVQLLVCVINFYSVEIIFYIYGALYSHLSVTHPDRAD
jgi:hypothetical protein